VVAVSFTISWGQEQRLLSGFQNLLAYVERLLGREHCTLKRH
jgi:glutathione S-transferase